MTIYGFDHTDNTLSKCYKLGQFAMPGTCENWLCLVNSCIYYAHQTLDIYQAQRNLYNEDREVLLKNIKSSGHFTQVSLYCLTQ